MASKKSFFRRAWKWFWDLVLGIGILQWFIAIIIAMPIWFVYLTSRIKITNYETFKKYRRRPAIFVFWHGRSMMLSPIIAVGRMRAYAIASQHHDGRIMAKVQRLFGLRPLYGSTTHGGMSVLRGGLRVLGDGRYSLCISPDGPGGPSLRIQDGTMYFSKMTGAPIIPVCYSASRAKFVNRWDRYMIAKPFSRINCVVGAPVVVPRRATDDEVQKIKNDLEKYMVETVHKMDAEFNHMVVEQDLKARKFKNMLREQRAAARNIKWGK
jgi:lysophospholipid acyltransferase (LPLAT)-like uncharacterized protein